MPLIGPGDSIDIVTKLIERSIKDILGSNGVSVVQVPGLEDCLAIELRVNRYNKWFQIRVEMRMMDIYWVNGSGLVDMAVEELVRGVQAGFNRHLKSIGLR